MAAADEPINVPARLRGPLGNVAATVPLGLLLERVEQCQAKDSKVIIGTPETLIKLHENMAKLIQISAISDGAGAILFALSATEKLPQTLFWPSIMFMAAANAGLLKGVISIVKADRALDLYYKSLGIFCTKCKKTLRELLCGQPAHSAQ